MQLVLSMFGRFLFAYCLMWLAFLKWGLRGCVGAKPGSRGQLEAMIKIQLNTDYLCPFNIFIGLTLHGVLEEGRDNSNSGLPRTLSGSQSSDDPIIIHLQTILHHPYWMKEPEQKDIPQSLLKNLLDRNVEKRQAAANELEQLVSKKVQHEDMQFIENLVSFFNNRYIKGTMESRKKAGLEALTAIAIGFRESLDLASKFIMTLINPILDCFNDSDSKVRFNAVKALYYVCKHLEEASLKAFNIIFLQLIWKIGDPDEEVAKAIELLNNALKSTLSQNLADSINAFDLQHFIGLVSSHLKEQNTQIREFLIDWINTIDQIPSIDLIHHLPTFMQDLIFTLGDKDKQLRSKAEECLKGFISGLKEKFYCGTLENSEGLLLKIIQILVRICMGKYCAFSKSVALNWFVEIFSELKQPGDYQGPNVPKHKKVIKRIVIEHFDEILQPVLTLLGHDEDSVRKAALDANNILSTIMENFKQERSINFNKVMPLLKDLLSQNRLSTNSEYVLGWMSYLLQNYNDRIHPQVNDIIQKVVNNLFLIGEGNIKSGTHILENVSFNEHYFDLVIAKILGLLYQNRFGDFRIEEVIKRFCQMLNTQRTYRSICVKLLTYEDETFISQAVQALESILATEKCLKNVRQKLRKAKQNRDLFDIFFKTFSYNPVSTLTLCYLSEQYELAYNIIISFTPKFITTNLLTKLCKLINLLQSPIFVYIRIHLLKRSTYPYLLESAHALLMVLPQGQVYSLLKNRIELIDYLEDEEDAKPVSYLQDMDKYMKIYQANVKPLV